MATKRTMLWGQRGVRLALTAATSWAVALAGCGSEPVGGGGQADTSGGGLDANPVDVPGPTPEPSKEIEAFRANYKPVVDQAAALTLAQLNAAYPDPAASAPNALPYEPGKAKYMDLISAAMTPNADATALLAKNGFVSSAAWQHETMAHALLWVFQKDLPVLVTSDMILQALHASYDDILKLVEKTILHPGLTEMLAKAQSQLGNVAKGSDTQAQAAWQDADLFVTVARSLLAGKQVQSLSGAAVDDTVADLLAAIDAKQMTELEIFGSKRVMDFSQFEVRGHYEGDPVLEKYFRTMMWLGRVDLRFVEPDAAAGTWLFRPRQLMAALHLRAAMQGDPMAKWQTADRLVTLMVGPVDYMDLPALEPMIADFGLTDADAVAGLDAAAEQSLIGRLVAGVYGGQQIASHYLETDPFSSEPTPLPPSFALLGQRFVIDSYVFANVVYDRVIFEGKKIERVLPSPLDAMFALGSDRALVHLQEELQKYPYQGALLLLRHLVEAHDDAFWSSNLYNGWLAALRALSADPAAADGLTSPKVPAAMQTGAWHDKQLRTQLASWAQLRHDTILYAKQSYTGGVACEHPDGYVEPVPAFWAALGKLAGEARVTLQNAPGVDANVAKQLDTFWGHWQTTMGTLETIARGELQGQELTADQLAFLKKTIVNETICGGPIFNGWYTSLYFGADNFDKWKPTIADVHTNPNSGPLPGPHVLHVATGNVELMIFTADTCTGAEAFVGPVFRYHEVVVPEIKRLKDSDWEKELTAGTAPGQPGWTASFAVP
ncbi:MAG: hypothetical protein RIT45_2547 [Pseudomonadota bacterium]